MRREALYLRDIILAAEAINGFLGEIDASHFLGDDLLQSAILHKLTIIGESAARLPEEIKSTYDHIEWRKIVALRNIVIHAYFSIDLQNIFDTAIQNVPELHGEVLEIVKADYPEINLTEM